MIDVRRSARLVSWGNAVLAGRVSPDTATDRVVGGDGPHRVLGLPGETGAVSLPLTLARLRSAGSRGLRLVLPVPGDPVGLPGPPTFNSDALVAGEAVLVVPAPGLPAYGLVPALPAERGHGESPAVLWHAAPVVTGEPPGQPTLAEAERMLREALLECTEQLVALDVTAQGPWRPELADALRELREDRPMQDALAPGYPGRAASVLSRARKVAAIAELAGQDGGGAVSASQLGGRAALLRRLSSAGRHAQVAAYNAILEPTPS